MMGDDTKVDLKTPPPANDVIISSPPESQSANESEEKESANQNPALLSSLLPGVRASVPH